MATKPKKTEPTIIEIYQYDSARERKIDQIYFGGVGIAVLLSACIYGWNNYVAPASPAATEQITPANAPRWGMTGEGTVGNARYKVTCSADAPYPEPDYYFGIKGPYAPSRDPKMDESIVFQINFGSGCDHENLALLCTSKDIMPVVLSSKRLDNGMIEHEITFKRERRFTPLELDLGLKEQFKKIGLTELANCKLLPERRSDSKVSEAAQAKPQTIANN